MADSNLVNLTAQSAANTVDNDLLLLAGNNASADRKMTIAEAKFALDSSEVFNVKDPAYGATGDGVTDDAAAIQAAADAAAATSPTSENHVTLKIPAGHYRILSEISIGAFIHVRGLEATIDHEGSPVNSPIISVGDDGVSNTQTVIEIGRIQAYGGEGTHPAMRHQLPLFACLSVKNPIKCEIALLATDGGFCGLELFGESQPVYKNNIRYNDSFSNKRGVRYRSEQISGWVNGNYMGIAPNCQSTSSTRERGNAVGIEMCTLLEFDYDAGSGTFQVDELIVWDHGRGSVHSVTGTTTGTIQFWLSEGRWPEDNESITGVTSAATCTVNEPTNLRATTAGYTGHNENTFYSPSMQMGDASIDWTNQAYTAGDQVFTTSGYVYEAQAAISAGHSEPSHVGGVTLNWRYLGPQWRSGLYFNGAGGSVVLQNARNESYNGPFTIVQTTNTSIGGNVKLNLLAVGGYNGNPLFPQISYAFLYPDRQSIRRSIEYTETFSNSTNNQLTMPSVRNSVIRSTNIVSANNGYSLIQRGGDYPVSRTYNDSSSPAKFTRNGVYWSWPCGIGILIDANSCGAVEYTHSFYPSGVGPRAIAAAYDEFQDIIDPSVLGTYPIRLTSSGSGGYSIATKARVEDQNGNNWPRAASINEEPKFFFAGLASGHVETIYYSMMRGFTSQTSSVIEGDATVAQEHIKVIAPDGAIIGAQRCADGEPTEGVFETVGERIGNLNVATDGIQGWIVQTAGTLAPAATDTGVTVVHEELLENGGNIYYKRSGGSTAGTNLTSILTGTNPATDLTDNASVVWRYHGPEANLIKTYTKLIIATEVSANATAVIGEDLPVNSTAAARTITFPSSPSAGDEFAFFDSRGQAATNNITTSSALIHGTTQTYTINTNEGRAHFKYINGTIGWALQ